MRRGVFVLGIIVVCAIVLLIAEIFSFAFMRYVGRPLAPQLFYAPPTAGDVEVNKYQSYAQLRHPILGWPRKDQLGSSAYDWSGARPSPSFPDLGNACVSLYGDSFTYGTDVSNAAAWGNRLAERLYCRVANYGVPGYGTDQAFLRFKENTSDEAPITILGIFHDNVTRNLTQNLFFLNGSSVFGFKPRFTQTSAGLELIALPISSFEELQLAITDPSKIMPHDWFLPGSLGGAAPISFPFTISLFKGLFSSQLWNRIRRRPGWYEYYDGDHPSGGLQLTVEIAWAFVKLAEERGKRAFIALFPSSSSFEFYVAQGTNPAEALTTELMRRGLPVIDLLPLMNDRVADQDYCILFSKSSSGANCDGHYNVRGYRMVADLIYEQISSGKR